MEGSTDNSEHNPNDSLARWKQLHHISTQKGGSDDLCYIDNDGFAFVVDRLEELIEYKGFQVLN
ncbi:hypothetical protein SAY87_012086 [Trapa incisa]|uniref:Uncharacterized protein n=1 Tax=Trapa incisa TaxID=236973 RepID=A0AAN7GPS8_9MYRT|nr:hypothetical protein SAY87_012086 [Trapa incisa]